ncbi:MAG: hypothetical protein WAT93_12325 [Pontixanthobacter sp.]
MNIWDEISTIVRRNLDVFYEIEAMDTGFRRKFDAVQRREKAPWIMMGRDELAAEELAIWQKLDGGEQSKADSVAEMRGLMASYYGQEH